MWILAVKPVQEVKIRVKSDKGGVVRVVADDEDIATVKIPAGKDWRVVKARVEKAPVGGKRYTGLCYRRGLQWKLTG